MIFRCDDASVTGHDHLAKGEIGQDYAISGCNDRAAWAIVSDGCSTGGRTDLGARLVALDARMILSTPQWFTYGSAGDWLKIYLDGQRRALGLDYNDLFATCVAARADREMTRVYVFGDGAVAAKLKDGSMVLNRFEWSCNMPLYPVYDPRERQILEDNHATLTRETLYWNGEVVTESFGLNSAGPWSSIGYDTRDLEAIAVFTDGVGQIAGGAKMGWREVVGELLAFKNTAGVFAKRRMNAFMRDLREKGLKPQDDLSYAVIRFEDSDG